MSWLALIAIYVLGDSTNVYVDNYVSDCYFKGNKSVAQKCFYIIPHIITALILIGISVATGALSEASMNPLLLFFVSGVMTSLAGIPYYRALELDNSTNLGIFFQIAPVLYLILGWLFFGEMISGAQLLAFFIISLAPLVVIFSTKRRNSQRVKLRAAVYTSFYVLVAVLANLIFVQQSSIANVDFIAELGFVILGKGIGNLAIIIARPKWRKRFSNVMKASNKKVLRPLIFNYVIVLAKDYAKYMGFILAPSAAIASAVGDSAEPIVIFLMGIIMTLIWPKFGREELKLRPIMAHLIATILIVIGITILR